MSRFTLGSRVAPTRFVVFAAVFLVGLPIGVATIGWGRGTMAAFDLAAAIFMASVASLLSQGEAREIRARAKANDANRAALLGITGLLLLVILVAVHGELKGKNDLLAIVLVITTLVLAWLFSNTIYALHYAHLYYSASDSNGGGGGEDSGGLDFPKTAEPDYWDFVYFSFTLGMTFQTSDVEMTDGRMRRVAIGQCLAAFVFNLGVLAFTINVLGGGSGG